MNYNEISDSETLKRQISHLKAQRSVPVKEIKRSFGEISNLNFKPVNTIKESSNNKLDRKRELINLSKIVLNRSTDYIIEQNFGKRRNIGFLLTSIIIELAMNPLINKNIAEFFSHIHKKLLVETECID